jgi:hypothetical protein
MGFPPLRDSGNRIREFLRLSPMNLGSRASYRHSGRSPLPTDLVLTSPIKALRGVDGDLVSKRKLGIEINPTFSPPPLDLNRPRLILKLKT